MELFYLLLLLIALFRWVFFLYLQSSRVPLFLNVLVEVSLLRFTILLQLVVRQLLMINTQLATVKGIHFGLHSHLMRHLRSLLCIFTFEIFARWFS